MAPKRSIDAPVNTKKRKEPPSGSVGIPKNQNLRVKRAKISIARTIVTQSSDSALKNGELDLQSFMKAREFEIKALESGMRETKKTLNLRAFQQVPRDMRRRTASHNVKVVPKRLQNRAKREQKQDNTPTVLFNKRKPATSRARIRAETAKRLGILAAKKRATKGKDAENGDGITPRVPRPKLRMNTLNDTPKPKSKFRKRQIHKTWLPTHLWHAKRANMTEPKNPLWRFTLPINCTEKSYRPTHRAIGARGTVAWDMSYMSTIGLEGPQASLEKLLKALGLTDQRMWEQKKWTTGKRSWSGWLSRAVEGQRLQIGPSTIVWCSSERDDTDPASADKPKKELPSQLFLRIHPSIFLETWTEVIRLSKIQRPAVHATDLRFEIGSIVMTGPGSTEALLGILHPYSDTMKSDDAHASAFKSLAGVTNAGSLPANAILSFLIKDPRLQYPPRKVSLPDLTDEEAMFTLLETLSAWPVDALHPSPELFDRDARHKASRLPSQKAINRRKSLATPDSYPSLLDTDPRIPVMLLASISPAKTSAQGSWTLLAPWKCITPVWYGLVHYPLSSGGSPRFGGLQELRQTHFEQGIPWFPADYPGTSAGLAWEKDEREKRKAEWDKRPKGKRTEWDSLDLGGGRKGEIGLGWACDFEKLVELTSKGNDEAQEKPVDQTSNASAAQAPMIQHLDKKTFTSLLSSKSMDLPSSTAVATIRLTLVSRGVATPCARIYRLPAPAQDNHDTASTTMSVGTREQWLSLLPSDSANPKAPKPNSKRARLQSRIPLNTPLPQRIRLVAQSLLEAPSTSLSEEGEEDGHPLVPGEKDLIGFVTTGEFNLAEGKGIAVGSIMVAATVECLRQDELHAAKNGRLCIVRNAGEKIGRLARWEPV